MNPYKIDPTAHLLTSSSTRPTVAYAAPALT